MISMEHSVVINRPVEEVFAFVADQANEPKWHRTYWRRTRSNRWSREPR